MPQPKIFNHWSIDVLLVLGLLIAAAIAICTVPGCSASKTPHMTPLHPVPPSLGKIDTSLDLGFVLGMGGMVAAAVMYFLIPEQHRISFALAGGGGTLLGLSLLFKVSLWIIPWIVGGLLIAGALVLCWEVWTHYVKSPKAS